ncbi:unnamed protein product, partial [Rotaria sp. Silwood2]
CDSSRAAQKLLGCLLANTIIEDHRSHVLQPEQQLLRPNLLNADYNSTTSKVQSQSSSTITLDSNLTNKLIASSSESSS